MPSTPLLASLLFALASFAGACSVGGEGEARATDEPDAGEVVHGATAFGTLASLAEHSSEEAAAGVSLAMIEIGWDAAEPENGSFNESYLSEIRTTMDAHLAAGRKITLGLALHYTPAWIYQLPNARMVDELGNESEEASFVFNQRLRDEADEFLAALGERLDYSRVSSIRITSAGGAELIYPPDGGYWAFDANAQNGPDMPPSMAPNPFPGFRPGAGGLSPDEEREWVEWYLDGLVDVATWQMQALNAFGFAGDFEVLTPGIMPPTIYEEELAAGLPRGLIGVGGVWHVLYRLMPRREDIIAYSSSVADNSGLGDGSCQPNDTQVSLEDAQIIDWSSTRWIARIAAEYGYRTGGENPGYMFPPHLTPNYLDDSNAGMMYRAFRQVESCGLSHFYWAHDPQLWDGTLPFSRFADYIAP